MKRYFVDAKITIGRAYIINANSEEEAKERAREDWEDYNDQAHFEMEMDVTEFKSQSGDKEK